jgi:hypothetical protein
MICWLFPRAEEFAVAQLASILLWRTFTPLDGKYFTCMSSASANWGPSTLANILATIPARTCPAQELPTSQPTSSSSLIPSQALTPTRIKPYPHSQLSSSPSQVKTWPSSFSQAELSPSPFHFPSWLHLSGSALQLFPQASTRWPRISATSSKTIPQPQPPSPSPLSPDLGISHLQPVGPWNTAPCSSPSR